ncbi:elongation factor P [Candidatus Protochlamydia phocaeensis]|uniref:elongation factor P n=1 Tax=Candidatus Protochlamydia phocaeensis TaxID=1414722 RepID=UPI0008397539|nr:elongation factor P [Candidatus Protochlamydia phocaeensis]
MVTSNQLNPGMTLSINNKLYRVESSVKVTVPKGTPFIKAKLRDLSSNEIVEKNFKLNQPIKDVSLIERRLEFLYPEGEGFLFLDISNLDQVLVPSQIVGNKVSYLKEGVELKAFFYGDTIFSVELPQFLELMVAKTQSDEETERANGAKIAILETGAKIEVPPFIETGDIIKVDTKTDEYIQRV